ncbi:BEL1-like homeodomain protein 2 [Acorus gramineus]|uniref:BEL1-like homeodomain protein 2 n=1 Tax=Acorus gramineus TaxID=55184 RepID=A0AAV9AVZ8_ACOGR|nr:BEL1-like homeodomain protein 2 [Acorus gramineus]
MSQGFHQSIFSFSDGFERQTQQQQTSSSGGHVTQQDRRDKLRLPPGQPDDITVYEAAGGGGMLSEMFNFPPGPPPPPAAVDLHDWRTNGGPLSGLNEESAAAMQLFLMNPTNPRSPPSPAAPPAEMNSFQAAFGNPIHPPPPTTQFGWFGGGKGAENQRLSLSLSSSLQRLETAKAEEVLFFNQVGGPPPPQISPYSTAVRGLQGQQHGQQIQSQVNMGFGSPPPSLGVVNVLRSSKYAKAAQELLREFCNVGKGQFKGRVGKQQNPNPSLGGGGASTSGGGGGGSGGASSSSKEPAMTLSPSDRFEHQRKKAKLLSMLDEVDRRYNHYCEQMQMVVNSFDSVMGFGAASPYTALAQKAMSRHFRCLKDAIVAQLKTICEVLGEKDGGGGTGITRGETPRLRLLDQSFRQQRAFHQMGMMEQEAWRPQRGLPERSVNSLRAWLFEHFLHPYPSDADKLLLARQTGLSRNQVSNWFINARVRLWKPMVEEMYQQESKEAETDTEDPNAGPAPRRSEAEPSHHLPPSTSDSMQTDPSMGALDGAGLIMDYRGPMGPDPATLGPVGGHVRYAMGGDVSLTLGLQHAGNASDKSRFSVRDYEGC